MPRCEDYPCCGHVEPDGSSFCPDERGRFPCATCGRLLAAGAPSAVCKSCMADYLMNDRCWTGECGGCPNCEGPDK